MERNVRSVTTIADRLREALRARGMTAYRLAEGASKTLATIGGCVTMVVPQFLGGHSESQGADRS